MEAKAGTRSPFPSFLSRNRGFYSAFSTDVILSVQMKMSRGRSLRRTKPSERRSIVLPRQRTATIPRPLTCIRLGKRWNMCSHAKCPRHLAPGGALVTHRCQMRCSMNSTEYCKKRVTCPPDGRYQDAGELVSALPTVQQRSILSHRAGRAKLAPQHRQPLQPRQRAPCHRPVRRSVTDTNTCYFPYRSATVWCRRSAVVAEARYGSPNR